MLDPNDAVWVLDVCDRSLGEQSQRGHRFAWLLASAEPAADPARVDAWYPPLGLVVDLRVRDDEEHHRRARIVRAYGLDYLVVDAEGLERDPQGRLRRTERDEVRIVAEVGEEARERQQFLWGPPAGFGVFGQNVAGWTAYAPVEEWDDQEDEDWDDGEEWVDDEDADAARRGSWPEQDLATRLEEIGPLDTASAEVLGWRGRSMAQALVGALALSRRALGVDVVGEGLRGDGLDVLLGLAAAEAREAAGAGLSADELAAALAVDRWSVERALESLRAEGLVAAAATSLPEEDLHLWVLAPQGLGLVLDWLGRASPLFGDWPPD